MAAPHGHHLTRMRGRLTLKQIVDVPLILYPNAPRPSYADQVLSFYRKRGLEPKVGFEVRELQTALGLVAAAPLRAGHHRRHAARGRGHRGPVPGRRHQRADPARLHAARPGPQDATRSTCSSPRWRRTSVDRGATRRGLGSAAGRGGSVPRHGITSSLPVRRQGHEGRIGQGVGRPRPAGRGPRLRELPDRRPLRQPARPRSRRSWRRRPSPRT